MKNVKSYYILLMMSMIIILSDQVCASYPNPLKKSATAAAMIIGATAAPSMIQAANQKFVSKKSASPAYSSLDQKIFKSNMYKQITHEIKKQVVNFPDVSFQQNLADDTDLIEGLLYHELTSHAQKVKYMQNQFKGYKLSDDFNMPLVVHFVDLLQDSQRIEFVAKMYECCIQEKSDFMSMHHLDKAFLYIFLRDLSKTSIGYLYQGYDIKALDWFLYFNELNTHIQSWFYPHKKLAFAYHEAAHALMFSLRSHGAIVSQLTLKPHGLFGGANMILNQYLLSTSISDQSGEYDDTLAQSKNKIMGYLAGGIGMQMFYGKKLSCQEFLA